MADQQYSQYPANQAGYSCGSYTGDSSYFQSGCGSANTGAYTNCTICFERWGSSSEHRLVSLRCGHLFGRSCISRWLKGDNARCPECNAHAREAEIINIYPKSYKVLDKTEHDKALEDLAKEVTARRNAVLIAVEERTKYRLAVQERERLKKELMDVKKQLQEYELMKCVVNYCKNHVPKFYVPSFINSTSREEK